MTDLHALGQRRGAGGVLQEGDMLAAQRRLAPLLGNGGIELVDAEQLWRDTGYHR